MKALILAAGYAKRLYPLTKEYPKPLLPIGKRALIDYIIDKLAKIDDITEVIVITNSKFIPRFKNWARKVQVKKPLSLVDDLTSDIQERRGAIGDMHFAIEKKCIWDDLLVIGGDNLFDGNLNEFLRFAKDNKPHPIIGVYDIKERHRATHYGVIKLDAENKVVDFKEKPRVPNSALVAMCLYYFPKEKLGLVREYIQKKTNKQDATGFYIDWLRKKETVYAFVFKGRWYDIGQIRFYKEAREAFV